ncbi:TetR/AcrR family transcriptional regulator [Actinocrispum wychmicini]|uniref:TetR family transcriptional regulator n=1 Tax=Actinocrispum wychmicini TaxID=1213861 RepID=A0A4R2KHH2_9PSEU|nr:TetR/AcrR family transcriptional regulator [Actinocrispum wychmicini]TCO65905.1 TetR family transcriptional regulator [Actinocrispum wychmicini]
MSEESNLASDLALLWGLREPSRRGPKPALTLEDIVRAAVDVADAEGLDAVSMARVAAQLGNSTMALYRHVKSKRELLVLMSDAALEYPPEFPDGNDWRAGMTLWAHGVFAAVRAHPWFLRIPISGPPFGPRNLLWFDRALGTLSDIDIPAEEKLSLVMGLVTYVQGGYRLQIELAEGRAEDPAAFTRDYAAGLRRVVDIQRMPALGRLVLEGVFDIEEPRGEDIDFDDFDFGLSVYLDGVAARIDRVT